MKETGDGDSVDNYVLTLGSDVSMVHVCFSGGSPKQTFSQKYKEQSFFVSPHRIVKYQPREIVVANFNNLHGQFVIDRGAMAFYGRYGRAKNGRFPPSSIDSTVLFSCYLLEQDSWHNN
ncbi:unnamed protein product [Vicia faba]|uniref:Uncharacterized protein n=1 Tax=Vicia faba TaxID=3906 RepID=A0AAV0Z2D5_VICFA|nr:unnamed protein product [Vicia faba]